MCASWAELVHEWAAFCPLAAGEHMQRHQFWSPPCPGIALRDSCTEYSLARSRTVLSWSTSVRGRASLKPAGSARCLPHSAFRCAPQRLPTRVQPCRPKRRSHHRARKSRLPSPRGSSLQKRSSLRQRSRRRKNDRRRALRHHPKTTMKAGLMRAGGTPPQPNAKNAGARSALTRTLGSMLRRYTSLMKKKIR